MQTINDWLIQYKQMGDTHEGSIIASLLQPLVSQYGDAPLTIRTRRETKDGQGVHHPVHLKNSRVVTKDANNVTIEIVWE